MFQRENGLADDGIIGPITRRVLIEQYMAEDGTTLPGTIDVTTHGCGENFPVDASGLNLDQAAPDSARHALDRRVELFFFNGSEGIVPAPPGQNSSKGSTEYPTWRREAKTVGDFTVGGIGVIAARSNTRFSQEKSFPKPSLLPTLRKLVGLLDGDAQLDLEIVGHADPRGDRGRNIHLSKSRAEAVGGW